MKAIAVLALLLAIGGVQAQSAGAAKNPQTEQAILTVTPTHVLITFKGEIIKKWERDDVGEARLDEMLSLCSHGNEADTKTSDSFTGPGSPWCKNTTPMLE